MVRPCFLVVDREYALSISTRKLVIETAKLNVITAYSGVEAIATLSAFPGVHGAVLDAGLRDMPCRDLVRTLKHLKPELPIIVVGSEGQYERGEEDYFLTSFEPGELLAVLKEFEGDKIATIRKHDAEMAVVL